MFKKRATQKDIARALKVGYITVQRAFQNSGYVSAGLKRRILAYADEVGYRPHRAAQALVRNRVRYIALFSGEQPNYFWTEVKEGAELAAEQISHFNYHASYHMIPYGDTQSYIDCLKKAKEGGVEAIAIPNDSQYDMPAVTGWIEKEGIPYMMFNVDAVPSRRLCYIGPDYSEGGELAANLLAEVSHGKGRLGIINFGGGAVRILSESIVLKHREKGFLDFLIRHYPAISYGILYLDESMSPEGLASAVQSFLASHPGGFDGLYFIPARHEILFKALQNTEAHRKPAVVAHDLYPEMEECLSKNLITAAIYQNPKLQGYCTVLVLEQYLETGFIPDGGRIHVAQSIVMKANREVYRNEYVTAPFWLGQDRERYRAIFSSAAPDDGCQADPQ